MIMHTPARRSPVIHALIHPRAPYTDFYRPARPSFSTEEGVTLPIVKLGRACEYEASTTPPLQQYCDMQ